MQMENEGTGNLTLIKGLLPLVIVGAISGMEQKYYVHIYYVHFDLMNLYITWKYVELFCICYAVTDTM